MTKKADQAKGLEDVMQLQEKVKAFEGLLSSIESLGDKKKALWKEIYENAITDRINAYTLFVELHEFCKDDSTQHAVQGPQLAKYLERMGKCTDQLIKLAELIAAAEARQQGVDQEEIYGMSRGLKG